MAATTAPPATLEVTIAGRARDIHTAWTADPEMPATSGCLADAVRVLAVRAAVLRVTGDEAEAALPAPAAVELSARLLEGQFPELARVAARTGHEVVQAQPRGRWAPGGRLHRIYAVAFGPVAGRHWAA